MGINIVVDSNNNELNENINNNLDNLNYTKIKIFKLNHNFNNLKNDKNNIENNDNNINNKILMYNLFLNNTNNETDDILLIIIITKFPNFLDLNCLYNININKNINFILLKVLTNNYENNILKSYFFIIYKKRKKKLFQSIKLFKQFLNKLDNNKIIEYYKNKNFEDLTMIKINNLKNFSKNIFIKIISFIIYKYRKNSKGFFINKTVIEKQNCLNILKNINNSNNKIKSILTLDLSNFDGDNYNIENNNYIKENNYNEIISNFMYLSNYKIAKNNKILLDLGITHIINLSQDNCININEKEFHYLSFNLKDNIFENIECIFFTCYEFIENCKKNNGKILIHCFKGISRSVAIIMSYLIIDKKITSNEAFKYIQNKRKISNPNLGFLFQLNNLYKKITCNINFIEIYAVTSFQIEQPDLIVCRNIYINFIDNNKIPKIDERGIYIICNRNIIFLLICNKIFKNNIISYLIEAKKYIELLKKYENINRETKIIIVYQNKENVEFNKFLLDYNLNLIYGINEKLDKYYIELNISKYNNIVNIQKMFYFYPSENGKNIINLDDLKNNSFIVCTYNNINDNIKKIFIWKGFDFNIENLKINNYINLIKSKFGDNIHNINEIHEIYGKESAEFYSLILY